MKKLQIAIAVLFLARGVWAQNPNTAKFPNAVATDNDLFVANNRPAVQKTLNGNITSGATTIVLSSGAGWLAPIIITVDSEIIYCSTLATNTLSGCVRAQELTAGVSHSTGANVYNYLTEGYTNQGMAEIKAQEAALAARTLNTGTGGGLAQAQTATMTPALTALTTGASICWKPSASNTGAGATLAVNGLTATVGTKTGGTALAASDIVQNVNACAIYNSTGPRWELQNPQTTTGGGGGGAANAYATYSFNANQVFARSAANQSWAMTLTGNMGTPTTSGLIDGDKLTFLIGQDVTGSHTWVWPSGFATEGCTISPTATIFTKQTFVWDASGGLAHAITPCVTTSATSDLMLTDATNTMTSTGLIDASGASVTAGLKVPAGSGANPTSDDVIAFNTAIHAHVWGSNGNTIVGAAAGLGTTVSTTCTNQFISAISGIAAPICSPITAAEIPPVNTPSPGATCTFSTNSTVCIATTTATITVPVPVAGYQFCALNGDNVSTVITLSAIGSSARYENTARTAFGTAGTGTLVSSGAVGDMVCIFGQDSTHYLTISSKGSWTAN